MYVYELMRKIIFRIENKVRSCFAEILVTHINNVFDFQFYFVKVERLL